MGINNWKIWNGFIDLRNKKGIKIEKTGLFIGIKFLEKRKVDRNIETNECTIFNLSYLKNKKC